MGAMTPKACLNRNLPQVGGVIPAFHLVLT